MSQDHQPTVRPDNREVENEELREPVGGDPGLPEETLTDPETGEPNP